MFSMCEAMQWNHLPVFGGLYDQDPVLLAKFRIIFQERGVYERQKAKDDEMKSRHR